MEWKNFLFHFQLLFSFFFKTVFQVFQFFFFFFIFFLFFLAFSFSRRVGPPPLLRWFVHCHCLVSQYVWRREKAHMPLYTYTWAIILKTITSQPSNLFTKHAMPPPCHQQSPPEGEIGRELVVEEQRCSVGQKKVFPSRSVAVYFLFGKKVHCPKPIPSNPPFSFPPTPFFPPTTMLLEWSGDTRVMGNKGEWGMKNSQHLSCFSLMPLPSLFIISQTTILHWLIVIIENYTKPLLPLLHSEQGLGRILNIQPGVVWGQYFQQTQSFLSPFNTAATMPHVCKEGPPGGGRRIEFSNRKRGVWGGGRVVQWWQGFL